MKVETLRYDGYRAVSARLGPLWGSLQWHSGHFVLSVKLAIKDYDRPHVALHLGPVYAELHWWPRRRYLTDGR